MMVCKIELKSIVEAYFDQSLSTNEFLDRIQEKDATLAKAALLWTKSRVLRTIECNVAFSTFLQKSPRLQNADLLTILKAYFDESVNIRDFLDIIRRANSTLVKAALMCTRSCVTKNLQALKVLAAKQVQVVEETLEAGTMTRCRK